MDKFFTGIPGFDSLLTYGIPEGSSIIVEGGPGSGKTTFCLQIVHEACKQGLKALYLSFEEPEDNLRRNMKSFGWDPGAFEKKGMLKIQRLESLHVERQVEGLLAESRRKFLTQTHPFLIPQDFEADVICIDSLSSIASAFSGDESRFRIYMEQLFRFLEKNNVRTFLVRETAIPTHVGNIHVEKGEAISFLSDGIVVLYNVIHPHGGRGRAIEILKLRGDYIQRQIVEAKIIDKKGIEVYPDKRLKGEYKLT